VKKNDFILVGIILIVAVAALLFINQTKKSGDMAIIEVGGKVYKELPLNVNTTIEIKGANGGTNVLKIEDGHADMIDADCPDKLCVKQKNIQNNGETLVCLPHKVIVKIESSKANDIDAVAN
jgi:hypothetical protein